VADAGASQFERGSIPQGQGFDSQLMEVELAQVPNPATRYVILPKRARRTRTASANEKRPSPGWVIFSYYPPAEIN